MNEMIDLASHWSQALKVKLNYKDIQMIISSSLKT